MTSWMRSATVEWLFKAITLACAAVAISGVGFVLVVAMVEGAPRLNFDFLLQASASGGAQGGIWYQLLGTGLLLITAATLVTPFACGIAVVEATTRNRHLVWMIRSGLHLLNSTPSILFGILGFLFFVKWCAWEKSWLAGGFVLALMILPTVTLSLMNRMNTIPRGYLETAMALGLTDNQRVRSILLPYGFGGLLTGLVMGLARAAGETAPIMFTAVVFFGATLPDGIRDNPVLALPYHIFTLAQDVFAPSAMAGAWATALVLIGLVFVVSLAVAPFRSRSHEEAKA